MYVNLHTLPNGQHMYTAYLGERQADGSVEAGDELDFVASARLSIEDLEHALKADETYMNLYAVAKPVIVGIVDQSDGEIVLDRREQFGLLP